MAFSNLRNPGALVMSGNPVLFTGHSNITSRLFPCVLGKFTSSTGYTEEYTYPLGSDGNFQFDLSEALEECFRQLRTATMTADGPTHTPQSIAYSLELIESWYEEGVTYPGATQTLSGYTAIPGRLTDAERMKMNNSDVAALLTSGIALTRKPTDSEVVLKDCYHIIPYMNGTTPAYDRTKRSALGAFTIRGRKVYVTDDPDDFRPIVFWNQFGLLESATAYGKPTYQHNLQSTQYEVDGGRTFHSIGEQHAQTSLKQQVITLSTGIVSRSWYEWWIAEVLTTPQIFVRLEGRWYSGTVVPESSISHQSSKGDALSVDFNVKLSVKGSIYNSFV